MGNFFLNLFYFYVWNFKGRSHFAFKGWKSFERFKMCFCFFLLFVSHCCFDTRNWTRMLFRIIKCKALEEIILVNDFLRFSTDELSLFIWCMCVYLLSIAIMFYVCAVWLWMAFIEIEWNCRHCVTLTQN